MSNFARLFSESRKYKNLPNLVFTSVNKEWIAIAKSELKPRFVSDSIVNPLTALHKHSSFRVLDFVHKFDKSKVTKHVYHQNYIFLTNTVIDYPIGISCYSSIMPAFFDDLASSKYFDRYNGSYTQWFPNGATKCISTYKYGILHGMYMEWDRVRRLVKSGTYNKGKKVGIWKYYYDFTPYNKISITYLDDIKHGKSVMNDKTGKYNWILEYDNDEIVSEKFEYIEKITRK